METKQEIEPSGLIGIWVPFSSLPSSLAKGLGASRSPPSMKGTAAFSELEAAGK